MLRISRICTDEIQKKFLPRIIAFGLRLFRYAITRSMFKYRNLQEPFSLSLINNWRCIILPTLIRYIMTRLLRRQWDYGSRMILQVAYNDTNPGTAMAQMRYQPLHAMTIFILKPICEEHKKYISIQKS